MAVLPYQEDKIARKKGGKSHRFVHFLHHCAPQGPLGGPTKCAYLKGPQKALRAKKLGCDWAELRVHHALRPLARSEGRCYAPPPSATMDGTSVITLVPV